jgi:hypothetical protein
MDLDRAALVICLTVGAIILINIMIYLSLRRGQGVMTVDLMRKATRRARNPWQDEDEALQELSEIVASLKSRPESLHSVEEEDDRD